MSLFKQSIINNYNISQKNLRLKTKVYLKRANHFKTLQYFLYHRRIFILDKQYLVITLGDPSGIGRIAILQLLKQKLFEDTQNQIIIVGDLFAADEDILKSTFKLIKLKANLQIPTHPNKHIYCYLNKYQNLPSIGKPSESWAKRSLLYLQISLEIVHKQYKEHATSLITLPVSKEWIIKSKNYFVGHTEELGKKFKSQVFMCMYHPQLSVFLLTNHIPLKMVPAYLKKVPTEALSKSLKFFKLFFGSQKIIGFCGLNPHAGENGKIGTEEKMILASITNTLHNNGINVTTPQSADSIFQEDQRKKYDCIIANYHDQGLIPFKALFGKTGINITMNLPFLRVSPDHGPAYTACLNNNISTDSIKESIQFALKNTARWKQTYQLAL